MNEFTVIQKFAVWVLPVLFAITIHETAHGWVASRLGDLTAKMLGRLTLNPIKHIDPVGTILIPAITMLAGGFIFGYANIHQLCILNIVIKKEDKKAIRKTLINI